MHLGVRCSVQHQGLDVEMASVVRDQQSPKSPPQEGADTTNTSHSIPLVVYHNMNMRQHAAA